MKEDVDIITLRAQLEKYKKEAEKYKKRAEEAEIRAQKEIEELKREIQSNNKIILDLKDNPELQQLKRIEELKKDIVEFKKKCDIEKQKKIDKLQDILTGCCSSYFPKINYVKSSFKHTFGSRIEDDKFLNFMEQGLSTLYSNVDNLRDAKIFFKNISEKINDFLYIPLIKENTLCELKKHLFLGVVCSQLDGKDNGFDYSEIFKYFFYTDSYFDESDFKEIEIKFQRNDKFVGVFPSYDKECKINLNLDILKKYIFSRTVQDALLETSKEIFGNAPFVNDVNIKNALESIYNEIIKKMRIAKLEQNNFGVTLYSKKIVISNFFCNKIAEEKSGEMKLSILAGFIITLLHEIVHCLTNYLPLYSSDYAELSNPFIRTYKKNIGVYNYVIGKTECKEQIDVLEFMENNIKNYELIKDSGSLFEKKIFGNDYKNNYTNSEYFLDIKNLEKSLNEYKEQHKLFMENVEKNKLTSLNEYTLIAFRRVKDNFYFGRCLLDGKTLIY